MKNLGDFIPIIGPIMYLINYYNNSKPIYLIIVFILIIEIHIVSFLYKYISYICGCASLRPKYKNKNLNDNPLIYNGMPSGHTSNITLFALLYNYTNNNPLFLLLIPIVAIQRYLTKAHTISQVIFGFLVGIIEYFIIIKLFKLLKIDR